MFYSALHFGQFVELLLNIVNVKRMLYIRFGYEKKMIRNMKWKKDRRVWRGSKPHGDES